MYRHFTGYPGGLVEKSFKRVRAGEAHPHRRRRHLGHASQDQARQTDVPETEGLCGRPASARGAEARRAGRKIVEGRSLVAATIVQYLGTGRRKSSVARVFLRPGKGEIKVNDRAFENYFPTESLRAVVRQPLGGHRDRGQVRPLDSRRWRRCRRPGGRGPSGHCQGPGGVQCGTAADG